jgi:hypothetical protein
VDRGRDPLPVFRRFVSLCGLNCQFHSGIGSLSPPPNHGACARRASDPVQLALGPMSWKCV